MIPTFWRKTVRFVAIVAIATWCISEPSLAQRGRGEGGGRGRSGEAAQKSAGAQRSANQSSPQIQSSQPRAQYRSTDGGAQFRATDGRSNVARRADSAPRSVQVNPPNQGVRSDQNQQSFYRGPSERSGSVPRTANAESGANRGSDWRRSVFRDDTARGRDRNPDNRIDDDFNQRNLDRDRSADVRNRFEGNNVRDRIDRDRFDRFDRDSFDRDRDRDDWSRVGDRIRDDWRRRDRNYLPFRLGWWDRYRGDLWPVYSPWRYSWWRNQPYYWWGWTPATRLTDWLVFGWDRPRYWVYGYGPGSNIYFQGDYVYYDNQQYLPVADYYQQVRALAHDIPAIDPKVAEQMEWAPLGVFAAIRNANDSDANQRTIQLAVNKDGVIAGTYYNPQNGDVRPISGRVDDRNQRAAWAFADGENSLIVFETSIFNLTRNETTMMVHFGPGANQTEVWRLLRLEQSRNYTTTADQIPAWQNQNSLP